MYPFPDILFSIDIHTSACLDSNCLACTENADVCTLCANGLLAVDGNCIAACPPGTRADAGVCATMASTSQSNVGLIVGVIVGVTAGTLVCAVMLRRTLARRHRAEERDLRVKLLESSEEGRVKFFFCVCFIFFSINMLYLCVIDFGSPDAERGVAH